MDAKWPQSEHLGMMGRGDGTFYMGSAVCRRGHVETPYIDPRRGQEQALPERCTECGAKVLTACPACQQRIRGDHYLPGVLGGFSPPPRPSFCDGCGAAFPWATRDERIYELENLLDEEDIEEVDRVVIQDHLGRLRATDTLSEKDEARAWAEIKRRSGSALSSPAVHRVVEGLVSAAIRHQLGI